LAKRNQPSESEDTGHWAHVSYCPGVTVRYADKEVTEHIAKDPVT
jgi:hypothetical protein